MQQHPLLPVLTLDFGLQYMAPPLSAEGTWPLPLGTEGIWPLPLSTEGTWPLPPGLQCLVQVVLPYPAALLGPLALAHRKEFPLAGHCMMASETSCIFAGSGRPRLLCRICWTACRHIPRFHCVFLANMSWTNTSSPSSDLYRSSPEFGLLPAGVFWITSCQCYFLPVYFLILHVLLYLRPQLVSRHGDSPLPPPSP